DGGVQMRADGDVANAAVLRRPDQHGKADLVLDEDRDGVARGNSEGGIEMRGAIRPLDERVIAYRLAAAVHDQREAAGIDGRHQARMEEGLRFAHCRPRLASNPRAVQPCCAAGQSALPARTWVPPLAALCPMRGDRP